MNNSSDSDRFTVYLRFPFPRNGFVDPPHAEWNDIKERNLWNYLSKNLRRNEINYRGVAGKEELCTELIDTNGRAEYFKVSVPFILQQAAWLYEKELQHVRVQMRKVNLERALEISILTSDVRRPKTELGDSRNSFKSNHESSQKRSEADNTITVRPTVNTPASQPSQIPAQLDPNPIHAHNSYHSSSSFGSSHSSASLETGRQLLSASRTFPKPLDPSDKNSGILDEGYDEIFLPLPDTREDSKKGNSNATSALSSFSDLSDTSISKSAMEEALLEMGNGSTSSRGGG